MAVLVLEEGDGGGGVSVPHTDQRLCSHLPRSHERPVRVESKANDVIAVPMVEALRVLSGVIDHTNGRSEVDELFGRSVEQVIPTLMPSIPVHPLQPQAAPGGRLITHYQHRNHTLGS